MRRMRLCARGTVKAVPPDFPGWGGKEAAGSFVNWHCHREAPGAALQSLING